MTTKILNALYLAINVLHTQDNAVHTIHQILYDLKDSIGVASAVYVQKSTNNDYLEIKNRFNVSEQLARTFKRGIGTDIIGRIFYQDEFAVVVKGGDEKDYKDVFLEHDYDMVVVLRVEIENRVIGYLALYFDNRLVITDELKSFLIAISTHCAESIHKEMLSDMIKETRVIDPQTGLYYYTHFHLKMREEFNRTKRMKTPFTVAIMDMDNFKHIMGVYGMDTANNLYIELAEELRSCIRGIDVLGRYGTDEFIIYMPNTSYKNAEIVLNRFNQTVMARKFTSQQIYTSLSIGIASLQPDETWEELLHNMQCALHKARLTIRKISSCDEQK
ncbi:MAG: GGDEF domain-containing protein [Nitrospirae bacterium]|nr:GGDEF domain-containing protein [Nitrospirota bacterium]